MRGGNDRAIRDCTIIAHSCKTSGILLRMLKIEREEAESKSRYPGLIKHSDAVADKKERCLLRELERNVNKVELECFKAQHKGRKGVFLAFTGRKSVRKVSSIIILACSSTPKPTVVLLSTKIQGRDSRTHTKPQQKGHTKVIYKLSNPRRHVASHNVVEMTT